MQAHASLHVPLIAILHAPDAAGYRRSDTVDESLLMKTDGSTENDHEIVEFIEYCLKGCPSDIHDPAHPSGTERMVALEQGLASCFCDRHVHRSVHVTKKIWPGELGTFLADFQ